MRLGVENANGTLTVTEDPRALEAFKPQVAALRFMMGCDVGWTGIIFHVLEPGSEKPRRMWLFERLDHVVDVSGHGYDVELG